MAFFIQIFVISRIKPYYCDLYRLNMEDFLTKVKTTRMKQIEKLYPHPEA